MSLADEVHKNYFYSLREEDFNGIQNGLDVLANAAASILNREKAATEKQWKLLRKVNEGELDFESPQVKVPIIGQGSRELHVGKLLLVPKWWPIPNQVESHGLSPSRYLPQTSQVDPSGVVFTGDDEDEDSGLLWILGGVAAVGLGLWFVTRK